MTDRSELALQLTDAILAAKAAAERAGDRAFRAYGLSHRAQAALVAVDQGGPDGARPSGCSRRVWRMPSSSTMKIERSLWRTGSSSCEASPFIKSSARST